MTDASGPQETHAALQDARPLDEAARALLGYFLYTWFRHFLAVVTDNLNRWWNAGLLKKDGSPNAVFRRALFDFNALNLEKLAYICGIYYYVQSGHKKANYHLLQNEQKKRVLYLRGYDYEASVATGGGMAVGISTADTFGFDCTLGDQIGHDACVFKVLSPKDLYWETVGPQRYFYSDYAKIIHASSAPIRSFFFNAGRWKEDVARVATLVDYFVVYVSSITESVLWELNLLKMSGHAHRTTVVFDRTAILNKALHTNLYETLPGMDAGTVIWLPSKKRSTEEDVDALRVVLEETFTVVPAETFSEHADALKARIRAADGPLAPGARETYFEFRFFPALDDAKSKYLRDVDAALWREIDPENSSPIDCLPFYVNQVQLRIFTALLFGEHADAGRALAAYAGVMDAALEHYTAAGEINERVSPEDFPEYLKVLTDHRETAAEIAWAFLCSGRSHEFGDYTKTARETYDRLFAASRQRAATLMREPSASQEPRRNRKKRGRRSRRPRAARRPAAH